MSHADAPARRWSRRLWLGVVLAGVGAGTGVGSRLWRKLGRPSAGDLADLVRFRLGHLNLEATAADQFAAEYVGRFGAKSMAWHYRQMLASFDGLGTGGGDRAAGDLPLDVLRFERRMTSYFLRSTDYFRTARGSLVRYVSFPDPYEGACTNPFAILDVETHSSAEPASTAMAASSSVHR